VYAAARDLYGLRDVVEFQAVRCGEQFSVRSLRESTVGLQTTGRIARAVLRGFTVRAAMTDSYLVDLHLVCCSLYMYSTRLKNRVRSESTTDHRYTQSVE